MRLQRLNAKGLERLEVFLDSLTSASPHRRPVGILSNPDTSEPIHPPIEIRERTFARRFDAAQYLYERFGKHRHLGLENDRGLWAWLTLFYFDQLCRKTSGATGNQENVLIGFQLSATHEDTADIFSLAHTGFSKLTTTLLNVP